MRTPWVCLGLGLAGAVSPAAAAPPSREEDLAFLTELVATRKYTLGEPVKPALVPDGSQVVFLRSEPTRPVQTLYAFDVAAGKERVLMSADKVLGGAEEKLSSEEKSHRERMRMTALGFTTFSPSEDGTKVLAPLAGRLFVVDVASGAVTEVAGAAGKEPPFDAKLAPDGSRASFVRGGELWVAPVGKGAAQKLTAGATETLVHAQAEFVAEEEMNRHTGYWWSPDAKLLAYEEYDASKVERLVSVDPAGPFEAGRPSFYPRPGKANVDARLGVVPAAGGKTVWVKWDAAKYPYLVRVTWTKGSPLTLDVMTRDQREQVLLAADPRTGATRELVRETDEVFLNAPNEYQWLRDGSGFVWATERRGAWTLELRAPDGKLVRPLTAPELGVRKILRVDDRSVIVSAGKDPVASHMYEVPLAGGDAVALTSGESHYGATFARDVRAQVRVVTEPGGAIRHEVIRADGSTAGELASVALRPKVMPRPDIRKLGDFWTAVVKPRDFDPKKKYPVLVSVYGGPHSRVVHREPLTYVMDQWMADHGYIVARVDGRGTPGQGRAWERVIFGKFADVPLEDQVAGLKLLGQAEPAMDLARVGIYGHSFGGYMGALSVLRRPDVFRAGVASAPVADWLDYDTFYTERYLGVPDKDTSIYDANGLLKYAKDLSRPLLIVHGTGDDNVFFVHSLKLADALFRAGKSFDFVPLARQTHIITRDPKVQLAYWDRIFSFFRQNL
ncbi:MAG TPA: DPP IV N-terminal domain-containing protein [Haliangiales bacterium]|nr:DPP IV N-terminal domain-containing protein [Haliangiales bacterium]